ncbi:hypothetical protein J4458_04900 [Candidatus Woesearchaeota archaeon]|nr:hypothetical protein [Candidatus Woesearchaeota archaeon]
MVSFLRWLLMKKKMAFFAAFIVMSFFFGSSFDSFFGKIRGDETVKAGETLQYHVNVVNHAEEEIEDVNVKIFIYDLDEMIVTSTFDVENKDNSARSLLWDTSDVEPGEYLARITLSNDEFREVKHRYITII